MDYSDLTNTALLAEYKYLINTIQAAYRINNKRAQKEAQERADAVALEILNRMD